MFDPSLLIAILLHDPVWKPWAISRKFQKGDLNTALKIIDKELRKRYKEKVLKPVFESDYIKGLLGKEGFSHEDHSRIFLYIIEHILRLEGLDEGASIIGRARDLITDTRVKLADQEASSLDRLLVFDILEEHGLERKVVSEFEFINLFAPKYSINPDFLRSREGDKLSPNIVADFMLNTSLLLAEIPML